MYRVFFCGHRFIDNFKTIEYELEKTIIELLKSKTFVEFYVGNHGDFDVLATSAVRRARKKLGNHNSTINLVLPYKIANLDLIESQFDSVIIPVESQNVHYKKAITLMNMWVIDNADMLISYANKVGGAFNALKYALKKDSLSIIKINENPNL